MPYDLFISYAHQGDNTSREAVVALVARLHAELESDFRRRFNRDLEIFFDKEDIQDFDHWQVRCHRALRDSRFFIAGLSRTYLRSDACRWEWEEWCKHEVEHGLVGQGAASLWFVKLEDLDAPEDAALLRRWKGDLLQRFHIQCHEWRHDDRGNFLDAAARSELQLLTEHVAKSLRNLVTDRASRGNLPWPNANFVGRELELASLRAALLDAAEQAELPEGRDQLEKRLEEHVRARAAVLEDTIDWKDALWELSPLVSLAHNWVNNGHPEGIWLLSHAGLHLRYLADWPRAESALRRALDAAKNKQPAVETDIATCLNNLAHLLQNTNRPAEAEPLYRRALTMFEQSLGVNHPMVATVLSNLARLLQATNRVADAEPMLRRALAISEATLDPRDPKLAVRLGNLGGLLQTMNRLAEAEPLFRRALVIYEDNFDANHLRVGVSLNNLGCVLRDSSRFVEAEPLLRRALAIAEANLPANHPHIAARCANLARLLELSGRLPEAERLYLRALEMSEKSLVPQEVEIAANLSGMGRCLQATKRLTEAELLYRRALAILEARLGPENPLVGTAISDVGVVLSKESRFSEAQTLLERALAIHERCLGPEHPFVANDLSNLAIVLKAQRRLEEAEPLSRRAALVFAGISRSTGQQHPHLQEALNRYEKLLRVMGLGQRAIDRRLSEITQNRTDASEVGGTEKATGGSEGSPKSLNELFAAREARYAELPPFSPVWRFIGWMIVAILSTAAAYAWVHYRHPELAEVSPAWRWVVYLCPALFVTMYALLKRR